MIQTAVHGLAPQAAATPQSSGAARQRSLMIDVVKGMAILLVTFGHTNQGIMHRTPWAYGERLNNYIYSFHMPAFFFVSGVFLAASLDKRGLRRFVSSKVGTILWPFWVFALIWPWVFIVLHRFVNSPPMAWRDVLINLVTGNQEWFLPSLFAASVAGALLRRIPHWLVFALTWALSMWMGFHPVHIAFIDRGLTFLVFLAAGMWLGPWLTLLERIPAALSVLLAAAVGYAVFVFTPIGSQPIWWGFVPAGLSGTLMLLLLAAALRSSAGARFFAWLGIGSLAVFLISGFGQGFGRALLDAAHVHSVAAHLAVGTALATLPPAWIYQHRERLHVGWMFVWPFGARKS